MSARFFSNRDVGHGAPLETLEQQQALVLDVLSRAGDAPVSYAELRQAGVEFPASVVSELELAGVPIERCHEHAAGSRRVLGVRLVSAPDGGAAAGVMRGARVDADAGVSAFAPEPVASRSWWVRDIRAFRRTAAAFGLAVAVALALALALVGLVGGGGRAGPTAAHPRPRRSTLLAAAPSRSAAPGLGARPSQPQPQPEPEPEPQPQPGQRLRPRVQPATPPPTPVSAALAAELEARGHELLATEHPGEAVPVLRRALAATGESLDGCLQAAGERCLTYAYALYDLGRALMLTGAPAAAVGVLEDRLRIENQQPVVAAELQSARRLLG